MIVYSKTKQLREIINLNRSKINHFANLISIVCILVLFIIKILSIIFPVEYNNEDGMKAFILNCEIEKITVLILFLAAISIVVAFLFGNIQKTINQIAGITLYSPIILFILFVWNVLVFALYSLHFFIISYFDKIEFVIICFIFICVDLIRMKLQS